MLPNAFIPLTSHTIRCYRQRPDVMEVTTTKHLGPRSIASGHPVLCSFGTEHFNETFTEFICQDRLGDQSATEEVKLTKKSSQVHPAAKYNVHPAVSMMQLMHMAVKPQQSAASLCKSTISSTANELCMNATHDRRTGDKKS